METILVKEVMTQNPVTIDIKDKVTSAIELMKVFDVGSVIVEENGRAVNIITQKDIICALYHKYENMIISEFIKKCKPERKLKTIVDSTTVYDAMKLMEEKKIKHLPVIDKNGRTIGIITATDILRKVTHVAFVDTLTKVYNRRYIDVLYFKLRERYKYTLMMLDIDNFKKINDTYGHLKGDEVLKALANTVKNSLRGSDLVIRWGGEEFLIILQHLSNIDIAVSLSEKLRKKINHIKIKDVGHFSCSFGVSCGYISKEHDIKKILNRADEALYLAKRKGKNRVEKSE